MPRLCSTTPMARLRRRRRYSSSTSSPSRRWDPRAAFAAATERIRAGTLRPEDAHHLFDELLLQANPVPERSLSDFLAALARAPSSAALRDGPSLALGLFNLVCREEAGPQVAPPTTCTYNILMDSCCRARRPDLGLAFFGRFLSTGLKANQIVATTLLKCLCHARRTDEAINVLLHRMSEFGCVPNVISYSIVLKSLCDDSRSQQALDLLQMVRKGGAAPSVWWHIAQ
uniref:Pentacotripeptide-repeat region of PRORP domain-containing protein n=1 Tax=Triticum aestivum TaxID=4565 RepID=A0A3B5ZR57_WHEAT